MKVIVMIGLPGSGKTTWANSFRDTEVQPVEIVSSDYYFTNKQTGEYKWTVETAHLGHENCLRDFISLLQNWVDGLSQTGVVIVDNTNVRLCDISSYIRIAQAFHADVEVKLVQAEIEEAHARNVHGVPDFVMPKMEANLERLLADWPRDFPVIDVVGLCL
jgi:predicted kinase